MSKYSMEENREYKYATKQIEHFLKQNSKILSITSSPFNSLSIFKEAINDISLNNKKLLYITNNKKKLRELLDGTLAKTLKLKYAYTEDSKTNIICLDFEEAKAINEEYDLTIIDDISTINQTNQIKTLVDIIYNDSKKIIVYSIEKISLEKTLEICDINNPIPILEPRIMTTRIDLTKDIPFSLYEYLKWFNSRNRNVIILVPDVNIYVDIIKKYVDKFNLKDIKIIYDLKQTTKINFQKDKSVFIITKDIVENITEIKNLDIVMLGLDKNIYSYKTIVYLSSIVANNSKEQGEILLIANTISKDMELAKNIVRNYNKLLWQKGLLNY